MDLLKAPKSVCVTFLLYALTAITWSPGHASDAGRDVDFSDKYNLIYQINVVSSDAGATSSIGSGFQVSADGLLVTNFHVVSDYVDSPDTYEIQYTTSDQVRGKLTLLDFDVVADLALLRLPEPSENYFSFATDNLSKGEVVYALGNPGDWGIVMVPGPSNGRVAHSFEERLLFSGSLNGGMSGGPSLNRNGEVIGINVATAGSQLSFLVPVQKAIDLVSAGRQLDSRDYQSEIAAGLKNWQRHRVDELLDSKWGIEEFADRNLIGEMRHDFQCWGDTNEDSEDRKTELVRRVCNAHDDVYINGDLRVGQIRYSFRNYRSLKLNKYQFADARRNSVSADNYSSFKYSTNYQCRTDFLDGHQQAPASYYKVTTCVRAYKLLEGLYDSIVVVQNHQNLETFSAYLSLSAVEKDQVQAMNLRFVEAVL